MAFLVQDWMKLKHIFGSFEMAKTADTRTDVTGVDGELLVLGLTHSWGTTALRALPRLYAGAKYYSDRRRLFAL